MGSAPYVWPSQQDGDLNSYGVALGPRPPGYLAGDVMEQLELTSHTYAEKLGILVPVVVAGAMATGGPQLQSNPIYLDPTRRRRRCRLRLD